MKRAQSKELNNQSATDIAPLDIWNKKYRLKAKDGCIIDNSINETYQRIARPVRSG